MWGPISKRDDRHYRRLDAEARARAERRKEAGKTYEAKREILDRVKAGEITLTEGQKEIRSL